MADSYKAVEKRIKKTIKAINTRRNLKRTEITREFNVSK